MTARRLFVFAFAAALLAGFGCSNDEAPGGTGPALSCTDGGNAAANGVNTSCGGAVDSETEQVNVVMGGPAAGVTTLRGLNFDVVYDEDKLVFVPSATYTSPLFPTALIARAFRESVAHSASASHRRKLDAGSEIAVRGALGPAPGHGQDEWRH